MKNKPKNYKRKGKENIQVSDVASLIVVIGTVTFDPRVVIFVLNVSIVVDGRSCAWLSTDVPHGVWL